MTTMTHTPERKGANSVPSVCGAGFIVSRRADWQRGSQASSLRYRNQLSGTKAGSLILPTV